MERHDRKMETRDHRPASERTPLLLGLWMRSVFVGVAVAALGCASMFDPQGVSFVTALILIVAGASFAWLAWRRTAALLDRIDKDVPIQSQRDDASSPRRLVRASPSS